MKLMFQHSWLCFRVRMTAALKQKHLQEVVVLDDDTDTMVALVGKRVVPILVKDDGLPMLESMDMVRYSSSVVGADRHRKCPKSELGSGDFAKGGTPHPATLPASRPAGIRHRRRNRPLPNAKTPDAGRSRRIACRDKALHRRADTRSGGARPAHRKSACGQRHAVTGRRAGAADPAVARGGQRATSSRRASATTSTP